MVSGDDLFAPLVGKCTVIDCERPYLYSGLCRPHYIRNYRYGSPLGGSAYRDKKPLKFLLNNQNRKFDECLIWPFYRDPNGYGQLTVNGKNQNAHRYMCKLVNGEPPSNSHEAAHSCGKGHNGCVSPDHLSWKLPIDNNADKIEHGTYQWGEGRFCAKISESEAIFIKHSNEVRWVLADRFGVSKQTVYDIQSGRSWRHLK